MRQKTNIALLGSSFIKWGGGIDFLGKFANVLALKSNTNPIKVYLLLPNNSNLKALFKYFLYPYVNMARDILRFKKPYYYNPESFNRKLIIESFRNINSEIRIIFYKDTQHGLITCLREIEADVVLPAMTSLGFSFPIPWIGYIGDFQHKYLPQFFSPETCMNRDHSFNRLLNDARAVLVNSIAVKKDINKFFPNISCHVFNLPFTPVPVESWFDENEIDVIVKYQLPNRYFIISNQFWIHKSHLTAFKALAKLSELHGFDDIEIICTGRTKDVRFPNYFNEVRKRIAELGIANKIHFLGHIPKKDQIQIMRGAIAVLQPTLFEGGPGGGAVHDAVAMGVPAIVSDIPVNLEIQEENVVFFKTGSVDDLVVKILDLLNKDIVRPAKVLLIDKGRQRAQRLGDMLLEVIEFV